jgi:hypothetical protein
VELSVLLALMGLFTVVALYFWWVKRPEKAPEKK